jgi:hypothetical protein
MYKAVWRAIISTAKSTECQNHSAAIFHFLVPDASIPREMKKPFTWQKREPLRIGPVEKVTIGYIMNHSALNMSLWISSIIRLSLVSTLVHGIGEIPLTRA